MVLVTPVGAVVVLDERLVLDRVRRRGEGLLNRAGRRGPAPNDGSGRVQLDALWPSERTRINHIGVLHRVFVSFALAAVTVGTAGAATADTQSGARATAQFRFRVVALQHTSTSQKNESPLYTGRSTSTWRLARATRRAPNVIGVTLLPSLITGLGTINVTGVFTAEATSNRPNGHCTLSAPTGSREYPAVAPGPFLLAVGPDPASRSRALVVGIASRASLSNPYFGSECSTSITGEPDADVMGVFRVSRSVFRRATITLRSRGSTNRSGIAYTWSTTIRLQKIVR
jgi:hypothetical protein